MEAYRTEEEQLEALRRWWREHGRTTLLLVVIVVAAVFGYRAWTQQQHAQREHEAGIYQSLLNADQQLQQPEATADQRRTAQHLARTLREEYPRSIYARLAALYQAKYAAEDGQHEAAEQALNWVIEQRSGDAFAQLARLRLASLYYGQGELERALSTLDAGEPGSYAAAYAALEGDIHYAQGNLDAARTAWQQAAAAGAGLAEPVQDPVLQLKLDNIAVPAMPSSPATDREGA